MIEIQLTFESLGRLRFGYSPLVELVGSLRSLWHPRPFHRTWRRWVQGQVGNVDLALLEVLVPPAPRLPRFVLGAGGSSASIEAELTRLAQVPASVMKADLDDAWQGYEIPPAARDLVMSGDDAGRRLADVVNLYWQLALESHWVQIKAVLDADVADRAGSFARRGLHGLLDELHPSAGLCGDVLRISGQDRQLPPISGRSVLLMPSIFVAPLLIVCRRSDNEVQLIYGARDFDRAWPAEPQQAAPAGDTALGSLIGGVRALVLSRVGVPKTTTELSRELGLSAPTISYHLSVLRRAGLVVSQRTGRRVVYSRTPLGSSLIAR